MTPLLAIDATAWWARCGQREVTYPCPVCFGKLAVTVILGNDEAVTTPCDYCGKGFDGPRGAVQEYEWVTKTELFFVSGITTETVGNKQSARYRNSIGYSVADMDLFETKEEAEAACLIAVAAHNEEEQKRRESMKEYATKNFSWHVGYHRREVKRAKQQLAWHEARAIACAARAKTPVEAEKL